MLSRDIQYVKEEQAYNTYKKIKTTESHFAEYAGEKYDMLTFDEITNEYADGFRKHLIGMDHLNNTVVKYTRAFGGFLNWCRDSKRKYYTGDATIKGKENEIEVIYLNRKEVDHLITVPLANQTLRQVRDVFVYGCFSSMRYKDIFNLKKTDIKKDYFTFYISKGGRTVSQEVPLHPIAKRILDRYKKIPGEKALPVLSNQKMNAHLKTVMEKAGFTEKVTVAEKRGNGKVEMVQYRKCDLISCHTSRKSFISIAVAGGMSEITIKSITGHSKNSRAFTRYYDISRSVKAEAFKKAFKK